MTKHTIIITPKPSNPEIQLLVQELMKRRYKVDYFIPANIRANIYHFHEQFATINPKGALVSGFGVAATQHIFFRLDLLNAVEELGIILINSRESLEISSDKFFLSILD